MDRIEKIQDLVENGYKVEKRQSAVLNNFYMMITIGVVCLSVLSYVYYFKPMLDEQIAKEHKKQERIKYLQERQKQIALAHKLNAKDQNQTKSITNGK